MGLPLLILWGNTLEEWVDLVQHDFPAIIGNEWEWYPLWRLNSGPYHGSEIQVTPPPGHPELPAAHKPILVVTLLGVAVWFGSAIDKMTYWTDFKLINLLHGDGTYLTYEDLHSSVEKPDNRWNVHLGWYYILTSTAKPSRNKQLSHCLWSFGMLDESHQY
jgi:hypothetical protein